MTKIIKTIGALAIGALSFLPMKSSAQELYKNSELYWTFPSKTTSKDTIVNVHQVNKGRATIKTNRPIEGEVADDTTYTAGFGPVFTYKAINNKLKKKSLLVETNVCEPCQDTSKVQIPNKKIHASNKTIKQKIKQESNHVDTVYKVVHDTIVKNTIVKEPTIKNTYIVTVNDITMPNIKSKHSPRMPISFSTNFKSIEAKLAYIPNINGTNLFIGPYTKVIAGGKSQKINSHSTSFVEPINKELGLEAITSVTTERKETDKPFAQIGTQLEYKVNQNLSLSVKAGVEFSKYNLDKTSTGQTVLKQGNYIIDVKDFCADSQKSKIEKYPVAGVSASFYPGSKKRFNFNANVDIFKKGVRPNFGIGYTFGGKKLR